MSDLDDFLNQMNITNTPDTSSTENTSVNNLSENDFNDILNDMGFSEAPAPEDTTASNSEVYNLSQSVGRNLDEEEDADWENRIASGEISTVSQPESNQMDDNDVNAPHDEPISNSINNSEELLVPENSPTLLIDETTSRFSGTEWYNAVRQQKVILAGCGGIGSWTALQLARLSPETLVLYDDDAVEATNMSGQLYSINDVGRYKVTALGDAINKYTTAQNVYLINQRYTQNTEAGDIMICGFDNMHARRTFFGAWQDHILSLPKEKRYKCLFIDGRLSIDTLQVLCITGDNEYAINEYKDKYLFSDSEADATICSMKQTTYLACMIGSLIVNLFVNHVTNTLDPIVPYDLPFFTQYDANNMIFKTEN